MKSKLILVLLIAISVRVFLLSYLPNGFTGNACNYALLAKGLYHEGVYGFASSYNIPNSAPDDMLIYNSESIFSASPNGTFPPLFPFTVYISYLIFGVSEFAAMLPALFFAVTNFFITYLIVRRFFGREAAFLAIIFLTFEYNWLNSSVVIAPEMEYAFFALVTIYLLSSKNPKMIPSGIFLGLATLTRYEGFLIGVAFILWRFYEERNLRFINRHFILGVLSFAVVVSPLLIRNYLTFGNPFFTSYLVDQKEFVSESIIDFFKFYAFKIVMYLKWLSFIDFVSVIPFLGVLGFILKFYDGRQKERFILAIFLLYFFAMAATHTWTRRYFMFLVPFLLGYAAFFLLRLRGWTNTTNPRLSRALFYFIIIFVIWTTFLHSWENFQGSYGTSWYGKEKPLEVKGMWIAKNSPKDAIIVVDDTRSMCLGYYSDRELYINKNISANLDAILNRFNGREIFFDITYYEDHPQEKEVTAKELRKRNMMEVYDDLFKA